MAETTSNGAPAAANAVPVAAPMTAQELSNPAAYAVNVPGVTEAITQPLFSYQSYAAAGPGSTPLVFFNTAPGNPSTVTLEDTNMELPGQLPAPTRYLIQGIGVDFISGNAVSRFGAESANGLLNDYYAVMKRGLLQLFIGNKEYLRVTSLLQLPCRSHIGGTAAVADATTAAAALQTYASIGYSEGEVFKPRPLLLEPSQNWRVTISYPGGTAPAIPSADAAARIGVWLYGTMYRSAQ